MKTDYEWVLELVDTESEDILDLDYFDTYASVLRNVARYPCAPGERYDIALVRGEEDQFDLIDRTWAYVNQGKLPTHFADSAGVATTTKVPQRFHAEVAKASH